METAAYGRPFWFTYGANTLVMVAFSLLYRYSDFVHVLGGTEWHLGWIVGAGMVGSLAMRLAQGIGIDIYGARRIWLVSLAFFSVACIAHLLIARVDGVVIYAVRILYATSVAGTFGASIAYVSRRAPAARMAEVIGMLGTSGFVGMVCGTTLGDAMYRGESVQRWQANQMFVVAAALGAASWVMAWLATRGPVPRLTRKQPPMFWLLRRYHPGAILLVGVAMGIGLGMPQTFLRPFAAQLNIETIGLFFGVYAPTAFVVRIFTRHLPDRIGVRPTIIAGMTSLVASMLLCLTVHSRWQLALPAMLLGTAHAFLFPAVISGISRSFPARYRGLGTTLSLAMFDTGNLIGAPMIGGVLHMAANMGMPPYPTMFVALALLLAAIGVFYAATNRDGRPPSEALPKPQDAAPANVATDDSRSHLTT